MTEAFSFGVVLFGGLGGCGGGGGDGGRGGGGFGLVAELSWDGGCGNGRDFVAVEGFGCVIGNGCGVGIFSSGVGGEGMD